MNKIPNAFMVGSLVYLMLCTRLDVYFTIGMMSRYRFNSRLEHWTKVKNIYSSILKE